MHNESENTQEFTQIPLEWRDFAHQAERDKWYKTIIMDYAGLWNKPAQLQPVNEQELDTLETRLNCKLPPALRYYHQHFGVLELGEYLCSVQQKGYSPIQPLLEAYPGIDDMELSTEEMDLVHQLVVFGDYLGNGNMFCFHRETQEVYYFDHDCEPTLNLFFNNVEIYLDALMLLTLAEIYRDDDNEEEGERLLIEKFGEQLVQIWRY